MTKLPLLLLPGTLCDATLFEHQLDNLRDVCHPQVVDIHLQDNLPDVARYVLSQVEGEFAVAGLSYGGVVAFELWRQAPDRITKIALLNTNPYAASSARQSNEEHFYKSALSRTIHDVATDFLKNLTLHPNPEQNIQLRNRVVAMSESIGVQGFINELKAQLARPSAFPDLLTMSCPVLVIAGRDDKIVPVSAKEEMAEKLPNATLKIIDNCGHLSTIEQPEQITGALREWLAST